MQYNSGVVEDVKPANMIFDDKEILNYFRDYTRLRTKRLKEIFNSWCVWGENDTKDTNNFNQLGSRIASEKVFSPVFIIHDSELNPDLYITDSKIMRTYKEFRDDILLFFDSIASEIIAEGKHHQSPQGFGGSPVPPKLEIIGPTEDKRALMLFKPDIQNEDFFEFNNFSIFASRTFGYLHQFFNKNLGVPKNNFAIYADNKVIIIVDDEHVEFFMEKVLLNFEKREKYHGCSHIIGLMKKWKEYIKNDKSSMEKKWEDYIKKPKNE